MSVLLSPLKLTKFDPTKQIHEMLTMPVIYENQSNTNTVTLGGLLDLLRKPIKIQVISSK